MVLMCLTGDGRPGAVKAPTAVVMAWLGLQDRLVNAELLQRAIHRKACNCLVMIDKSSFRDDGITGQPLLQAQIMLHSNTLLPCLSSVDGRWLTMAGAHDWAKEKVTCQRVEPEF